VTHVVTTVIEYKGRESWISALSVVFLPYPASTDTMASAFFYGTLMHPKILKRVLHNDASHLKICSAILMVGPLHAQRHASHTTVDISDGTII